MSPQGPSSFIPKAPTTRSVRPRGVRKIYVFTYLSLVLFFGTLIASAGTFFFDLTVKKQLDVQKQELANEQNAFNARDLERLRELESRIENSKQLLNTHVSVADIFSALETSTIATVQLTGVKYERTAFGGITLALSAVTDSFNDARFQRDIYASNEVLRDAGVVNPEYAASNEQSDGKPGIIFELAGDFAVSDIAYRNPEPATVSPEAGLSASTTLSDMETDVVAEDEVPIE